MAGTLENVMIRHNDLQETLDSLQTQLGRKDSELASLQQERYAIVIVLRDENNGSDVGFTWIWVIVVPMFSDFQNHQHKH